MIFASVDIGTNAGKLLFSNVFIKDGVPVAEKISRIRIPLRLGDDVFNNKLISKPKQEELIKTLTAFKLLIDVYKPLDWVACASSAMREATNSKQVLAAIKKETGIDLKVISGLEEARLITAADNTVMNSHHKYKMFVDLGGGSMEISVLQENHIIRSRSFSIGVIRYINDKIDDKEWDDLKKWLKAFKDDFNKIFLIGSGGTINNLAKLYGLKENKMISFKELKKAKTHLSQYSLEERVEKLGIRPDRADVIVPACDIFLKIMKWIKSDKACVPGIGLADGLIYELYREYVSNHS